ncbi:3-deoxy-D-manno-octulosonic acid transferase [Lutimonas zeaxanthinifaciens]|uniref:3-deoxy-D-manno-octulosonic acid transferase n=1 Tax=Lutimonas zeaxanthinifaciens TaxID=3060215 RepID=UPI00265D449E|nr:glycosyltransferase N-terminal domain-containing protein [Lutimonas sp. YSD2104]WKK66154.1 glycosyltransferase N-terminal domain-containing protein [Lutimonas sp. YSD2104]
MSYLYNFAIFIIGIAVRIVAVFNGKMSLFVKGRKETFSTLAKGITLEDKTIWMHCASLGEFEQGRPVIESLKKSLPGYQIVLSFFSPSGYEIQKKYDGADVVVYLPLDSKANAKKFIQLVNPSIALFVKYEFWPNILKELKSHKIETILVSGIFRKDQLFFKPYGGWMRQSLKAFTHFFVQNEESRKLLNQIEFRNVVVSGDTRFDRVSNILEQNNQLKFLENFVKDRIVIVAGSTWSKDEKFLTKFMNENQKETIRLIVAPHNIVPKEILRLKESFNCKTSLYSEGEISADSKVFIADTVGILTKIYSYAHIAYIGGGFDKDGVHNVLEPAVFGIPLLIGPEFEKFEEAKDLVNLGGCLVAKDESGFIRTLNLLVEDGLRREKTGDITKSYIKNHIGATEIISSYILKKLK